MVAISFKYLLVVVDEKLNYQKINAVYPFYIFS